MVSAKCLEGVTLVEEYAEKLRELGFLIDEIEVLEQKYMGSETLSLHAVRDIVPSVETFETKEELSEALGKVVIDEPVGSGVADSNQFAEGGTKDVKE